MKGLFLLLFSLKSFASWHIEQSGHSKTSPLLPDSAKPVIIAIIDSGFDLSHPLIQNKLWHNQKEIPNNGIDDDYNGYIDDIVGWNFLGSRSGSAEFDISRGKIKISKQNLEDQVYFDSLEIVREFNSLFNQSGLNRKESRALDSLMRNINEKLKRANQLLNEYKKEKKAYELAAKLLNLDLDNLSYQQLTSINSDLLKETEKAALKFLTDNYGLGQTYSFILEEIELFSIQIDYHYNINLNEREKIIADNPEKLIEKGYGNNDVQTNRSAHGTSVATVLAQATQHPNISLMLLRSLPNGDERDKDVISSIYYAVDNGADIINISFGKYSSPNAKEVYEAMEYAQTHGVTIVLAAGNDYLNIDHKTSFPSPKYGSEKLENTLMVGSHSRYLRKSSFSNYGELSVDIYAPGENISIPDKNSRDVIYNGTSYAAPLVSAAIAKLKLISPDINIYESKSVLLEGSYLIGDKIQALDIHQSLNLLKK